MVSIGKVFSFLGHSAKRTMPITEEVTKLPLRTKVMTDIDTGIIKMEREFSRNGDTFLARVERQQLPNGGEKTTTKIFGAKPEGGYYFGQGDEGVRSFREKEVIRDPKGSLLGGDRVQINKNYHETMSETAHYDNLTKDYNSQGILEHKELEHKYRHWEKPQNAVQDRVYEEYPLNHSVSEMLENPGTHTYYKHKLDGSTNYYHFASSDTRYSKAIAAKEQVAIDVAKKTEAEAIAAKEAAEKVAAELKAKQPRANLAKILNRDINDLVINETKLANGAVERTFTDPETGKILVKTKTHGLKQEEWYYGGKADEVYVKLLGENDKYILAKKGNYKYSYSSVLKNGYGTENSFVYYDDGINSLKYQFDPYTKKVGNADGCIRLIDSDNETKEVLIRNGYLAHKDDYGHLGSYFKHEIEANPDLKKVNEMLNYFNKETQKNSIDLKNLIRPY